MSHQEELGYEVSAYENNYTVRLRRELEYTSPSRSGIRSSFIPLSYFSEPNVENMRRIARERWNERFRMDAEP